MVDGVNMAGQGILPGESFLTNCTWPLTASVWVGVVFI